MSAKDVIVGIDLGTTHSLIACVLEGKPTVLETREGKRLLPSVVSFLSSDSPAGSVIGYAAKGEKVRRTDRTVYSVKRLLGRKVSDLSAAKLPYELVDAQGSAGIRVGEKVYSAIEISAMILRELKLGAEERLGHPVTRAVITVPAYFDDSQRQATRTAGRLAGLEVLRIINEPTAASLAYGLDRKKQGLIAVYDLGGGTFDVSILKLHDGIFEVLSTNGDTSLGGDDLDREIARLIIDDVEKQRGIRIGADPQAYAAVLEAAEEAKIALSQKRETEIHLRLPGSPENPGRGSYSRKLSREEFESAVAGVLDRTREPCKRALEDAGIRADELSDVVLVGGPTRLDAVQRLAREIFGREPNTAVHPDEVVAIGAAIQADILAGNNREMLLLDVVPLSLGIETYGGLMSPLITRNSRIPTAAREVFTTFMDKQTGVDIHVLQGERERAEDNRSLARFKLGVPPLPAGMARVEVLFLIDADGILQVAAKDLKTGEERSVEVRPSYGLTDRQVEEMLQASAAHAEEDVALRKLVETRNEAQAVLNAAEGKLPDARNLLSEEELSRIEASIRDLRSALSSKDPELIRKSAFELNRATGRLADLLLREALAKRTPGRV